MAWGRKWCRRPSACWRKPPTNIISPLRFRTSTGARRTFFRWGKMMPSGALDLLQPCDAILLGAVGHPDIPDHTTLNGLLLPIRRAFDQYANVRPAYLYPGVKSPLAGREGGQIDMVVVRENTEGEYAQVGGFVYLAQPEEVAIQTAVFTRRGVERVVRYAFDLAVKRGKKMRVTSITKSNAQRYMMAIWPSSAARKCESRRSPNRTRRATAWRCGFAPLTIWPRNSPASKPNPCWWMPPP